MANNPFWSDEAVKADVDAITGKLNSGLIKIYTGSQPADANSSITGTLLATLTLNATAFPASSASGSAGSKVVTATANSITSGIAGNTGTAGYFVVEKSDASPILMGSVGTSGADMNLDSTSISSGATVSCSAFTITQTE